MTVSERFELRILDLTSNFRAQTDGAPDAVVEAWFAQVIGERWSEATIGQAPVGRLNARIEDDLTSQILAFNKVNTLEMDDPLRSIAPRLDSEEARRANIRLELFNLNINNLLAMSATIATLRHELDRLQSERDALAHERALQIDALGALEEMKASRSWRWTAWLRALRRPFTGIEACSGPLGLLGPTLRARTLLMRVMPAKTR